MKRKKILKKCNCEDKFKKVAPIILKHEGGYVNDPNDSGGKQIKELQLVLSKLMLKKTWV